MNKTGIPIPGERLQIERLPAYTGVRSLPAGPGVYRCYGEQGALLYVGKSINIRERVQSHYAARFSDPREGRLAMQTYHIDHTETAGELGALLLENHEIKTRRPLYNQRQRRSRQLWTLRLSTAADGFLQPQIIMLEGGRIRETTYWACRNRRQAQLQLRAISKAQGLCPKRLGLERGGGRCFGAQLGHCRGACIDRESAAAHNERLLSALAEYQLLVWPYDGPVAVVEISNDDPAHTDWHLLWQWGYLGTVRTKSELGQLWAQKQSHRFDLDTYHLLLKFLHAGDTAIQNHYDVVEVDPIN
ncbi:DNA polymerase-3 subunit epsilon [Methylohalomonas lacus]|uniref:Excinuclease cho n=1 Tax=Methylohalomonas lacus TaxID=398773 RepID=A0AAE3HND5_9GAMM|nr:GIY-YIG nuclease family protein [Methylohalomonas lacus]MCS3903827.1 DNA polymerase-3 subunit epsilon [Methylohalomonas lacus]